MSIQRRLYTIGHSTRTASELVAALQAWRVATLVDIRHFDLGGRRPRAAGVDPARNAGWTHPAFKNYADYAESPAFQRALDELLALARRSTCVIMCAEAVWWRCHRRIVTDYALTKRVPVWHIFTPEKAVRATRTPCARYDRATRTLRYPAP